MTYAELMITLLKLTGAQLATKVVVELAGENPVPGELLGVETDQPVIFVRAYEIGACTNDND